MACNALFFAYLQRLIHRESEIALLQTRSSTAEASSREDELLSKIVQHLAEHGEQTYEQLILVNVCALW